MIKNQLQFLTATVIPIEIPVWQQGDPWYLVTYLVALGIVIVILGISLGASLRRGNGTFRKRKNGK